jgi:selenide, water dikinase
MGGTPVSALNLVAYPLGRLGSDALCDVLRGGADVLDQAGALLVGGHSIDDPEPKYGLAVTGVVRSDDVITNTGGRVGDVLVLTKPLGVGAITTAIKRGAAGSELLAPAVAATVELNADAAGAARRAGAHAMTDVTGFGLLGHLRELTAASGVAAELDSAAVPAIDGVLELLASSEPPIAGGSRRNREWVEQWVDWDEVVPEERRWLLCDAMTSGGLLVAAPAGSDAPGVRIGRLAAGDAGRIRVL